MRRAFLAVVSFGALFVFMQIAVADDGGNIFRVDPRHAGINAMAGWQRDAGEPGQKGDPLQYGLHLLHNAATTPDGPFAGTDNLLRRPIRAQDLTRLGFSSSGRSGEAGVWVAGNPKHAYCSGGSPRFVIESTSGTCHLGCAHADQKIQDPDTNWWDYRFNRPFARAGCPIEPAGQIDYMDITVDEGYQPATAGGTSVTLDNILATIGGKTFVIGAPDDTGDRKRGKSRDHHGDD
jgi:hypothetical protein